MKVDSKGYAMKHWLLLSILGTVLVVGCGKPKELSPEEQAEKTRILSYAKDLDGSYLGACVANPDQNLKAAKSLKVHYSFSDGNYLERQYAFEAADCSGEPIYFLKKSGKFTILTEREQSIRQINLSRTGIDITPNVGSFVDYMNLHSVCGSNEWMIGQPIGVGGVTCWGVTAYPKGPRYDIFSLQQDGEKLCFGKLDDPVINGTRESLRPKVLGPCYDLTSEVF